MENFTFDFPVEFLLAASLVAFLCALLSALFQIFAIHLIIRWIKKPMSSLLGIAQYLTGQSRHDFFLHQLSWLIATPFVTGIFILLYNNFSLRELFNLRDSNLRLFNPNASQIGTFYIYLLGSTLWRYDKNLEIFKPKSLMQSFRTITVFTLVSFLLCLFDRSFSRRDYRVSSSENIFQFATEDIYHFLIFPVVLILLTLIYIRRNKLHEALD